jgi:hypothetical protein
MSSTAVLAPTAHRAALAAQQTALRPNLARRHRGVVVMTALAIGLSIPLTGAGSAVASPRPPSLASTAAATVAATSALTSPVAMGKYDV